MLKQRFYYLIHLEFLGFRYHGWQKQPEVKTVQYMLDRTLQFILGHNDFKTLGASRTDAMVSAQSHLSELFIYQELNPLELYEKLNCNLPADIRASKVERVDDSFEIIGSKKLKEYHYYFSYGEKPHPFCAPFLANFQDELDIQLMQEGASLFKGHHNFKEYCYRPNPKKVFDREIFDSEVAVNKYLEASFFPKNTYVFRITGMGFLHHQVRLMMGTLIRLGKGEITLPEIKTSLKGEGNYPIGFVAPSSGLHLFKNEILGD